MNEAGVVIVGAGQAGFSAASKLRSLGYQGSITMFGNEGQYPYQRPPLSKSYLLNEMPLERLYLRPASFYEEQSISMRMDVEVTKILPETQHVLTTSGEYLYTNLILATGATPRRLPRSLGGHLEGTYTIRNIGDIDTISPEFVAGRKLVIVGGGYIGLEVAAVARSLGLDVTLIEAEDRILKRVAAQETSAFFSSYHRSKGVDLRENTKIKGVVGKDRVSGIQLSDGSILAADFVVFGVGVSANTELAKSAGLKTDTGVATDAYGRCSKANIWAAGDCASLPFDGEQIRIESVGNAIDQAELVAQNIMGAGLEYNVKPWFWSDQYDVKLQICGLNTGFDRVESRVTSETSQSFWYYREGQLIAVDAINDPRAYMTAKRLIESGKSADPKIVCDPASNLKELFAVS
ncbi:NAD(P)/FAD-dependent oxidoreductase [Epibacterium ulvae]|uniref:NAD(P)/FAD-dependent oxidoreductase n=1 Tax=Epibacterium ulvae TaxID=1156985 RepID=UPI0024926A4C|nr:FAD-dependent oxidoreductase [Epibacterium ulvae]